VKHPFALATVVAVCTFLNVGTPAAKAQQPPAARPSVAIIDLTYIFENHQRFGAMKEDMKRDVKAAEETLKNRSKEVQGLGERLRTFQKGSRDYKELEEELASRSADLSVQAKLQQKQFLEREAKMYYNVYREIIDAVHYYAQRNNIQIVLRFNGAPVDTNDPQEVLKELNKAIVWHTPTVDITPYILAQLNRTPQRQPKVGRRPNAQGVPRPAPR